MNAFGVVAEFNPFHEGHSYFIEKAKELTGSECCVAAMSGDFTQRGEPAIFDKWERAKKACEMGADLVVEIPQVFACQSAPYFARGGVEVLRATGIPDYICFGSETGDIEELRRSADHIKSNEKEINRKVAEKVKEGKSYPLAREEVLSESGIDIASPGSNDILALEYLMQDLGEMVPVAVKRSGESHVKTATRIRDEIEAGDPEIYETEKSRLFDLISCKLLSMEPESIDKVFSAGYGLGRRIMNSVRYSKSLEELSEKADTKVYTRTRVNRALINILLGIRESDVTYPGYIRVLAMNDEGARLLKEARSRSLTSLPVISNLSKETDKLSADGKKMISFDILAGDVYNIIKHNDLYENCELVRKPYKI